jgi:CheY-like chemotaxis protein
MELNRVLIVDDDPAIRRVVSALLDLDEYGLLEAADGQVALEVVRDERQLVVFAHEINHLYQAERARAAELERALERLRASYLT